MPLRNLDAVRALAARKITAFATDAIPRTTRAQAMDTLSSMANIGGYKGVLLAAVELNRYFPMLMTAAGMVLPAKVFVIGAGVAGPAGDRHRAAARRQRRGDRRAAGSEGTDRERRRQIRRHRAQGERGRRRRLRQGAVGGGSAAPEPAAGAGVRAVRRGDHDGAHRRRVRAAAHHRRHGESDEAGIGDRRSRRRRRRQLRAVEAGRDGATWAASRFSRRSTCRRRCRSTRACCSRGT